jgi:choline-sulfatase
VPIDRHLAAAVTVLLAAASACARPDPPPPAPARPNLLIITIDTLRADRVGAGLTPAIDGLAARGTRFTLARSVAPLTLPAHVSLMTGVIPPVHGVRLNGVHRFDGRVPALAPRLREAGYETAAFVGAYVLDRRFGLADGFDVYDDRIPRAASATQRLEAERRAEVVADRAAAWVYERAGSARPWFAWVHFYDPHAPYEPPPEFLARAGGRAYDGEVAYTDAHVARLIDAVGGTLAQTIVVVAGDHGESLGDPVSLVDVAPTVAGLAGLSPVAGDGTDLFGDAAAEREAYAETDYPLVAGWSPLASLADDRWKLVDAPDPELYDLTRDRSERQNLASSQPGTVRGMLARLTELRARATASARATPAPDVAERLRALGYVAGPAVPRTGRRPNPAAMMPAWAAFESALSAPGTPAGAAASLHSLRALARQHPGVPIFQTTLAGTLAERGQHREALAIYRRAVERWPDEGQIFHDLAASARAAGLIEEARRAEEAALALDPENPLAHNGLGLLLAGAGRPGEARRAFERAAALDPTNAQFAANLANAAREAGDAATAGREYRRALDLDPELPDALNGLAVLLVQAGRAQAAIPLLERALVRDPAFIEARLNLGIAAQEAGDLAAARAAYAAVLRAPAGFEKERRAAADLLSNLAPTGR